MIAATLRAATAGDWFVMLAGFAAIVVAALS